MQDLSDKSKRQLVYLQTDDFEQNDHVAVANLNKSWIYITSTWLVIVTIWVIADVTKDTDGCGTERWLAIKKLLYFWKNGKWPSIIIISSQTGNR